MIKNPSMLRPVAMTLLLAVLWAGGNGCSMFDGKKQMILVEESQLNALVITYQPGMSKAPVQLSLMGSGHITIKRGTSPLIANAFTQDVANQKWGDVTVDQITIEAAQMREVFQALVNRGVLREPDPSFVASADRGSPIARIVGTLNNEPVARLAVEPELVSYIRDLIKLFDENMQPAGLAK